MAPKVKKMQVEWKALRGKTRRVKTPRAEMSADLDPHITSDDRKKQVNAVHMNICRYMLHTVCNLSSLRHNSLSAASFSH